MTAVYYEDLFLTFVSCLIRDPQSIDHKDFSAMISFESIIVNKEAFTARQAAYLIRLIKTYNHICLSNGHDIEGSLETAQWKMPFRTLDLEKKAWVEEIDHMPMILLKFPFDFKNILNNYSSQLFNYWENFIWDRERKVTKVFITGTNLLFLNDILEKHGFQFDDSYLHLLGMVEEAIDNEKSIVPHCTIRDGLIILNNASENAENFWRNHKKGEIYQDLFLAKSMGYRLKDDYSSNLIKKIARCKENKFWTSEIQQFLEICQKIHGTKIIYVGAHRDFFDYTKNLIEEIRKTSIPIKKVKICFREQGEQGRIFNDWVKENCLGGKIDSEEILIFKDKTPKWIFSKGLDVKIIAINSLFPVPNRYTRLWTDSHPCVIFLGEYKASTARGEQIAKL